MTQNRHYTMVPVARRADTRISQQLREFILTSGISRYRICKDIGLPESTMSHFLAGHCGLALPTIDNLCQYLGLRLIRDPYNERAKAATWRALMAGAPGSQVSTMSGTQRRRAAAKRQVRDR